MGCGHVFGRECIERWLAARGGKCPTCNRAARTKDVVPLFVSARLAVAETGAADAALQRLGKEKEAREAAEKEATRLAKALRAAGRERDAALTQAGFGVIFMVYGLWFMVYGLWFRV